VQLSGCPNNFRFSYARFTPVYPHWDHTLTCILCFAAEFGGRACPGNNTSVSKPKAVEYPFVWTTSGNFRFFSLGIVSFLCANFWVLVFVSNKYRWNSALTLN
jgi:hypothetical protein